MAEEEKEIAKDPNDLVARGSYRPSPLGRSIFVGLRAIDPLIQYAILSRHAGLSWIPRLLGGSLLPVPAPAPVSLPPYQSLLLIMSIGSMLKQTYWALFIGREEMLPGSALLIAGVATLMNSLFSALASWSRTSADPSASTIPALLTSPSTAIGILLFTTGIFTELISEIQRSNFKTQPRNKGKPFAGGLFGLARNINYTGFMLWKAGYALVAAGPGLGVVIGAMHFYDFSQRAIPMLDGYCERRYGRDWAEVKKRVGKVLVPGIY